MKLPNANQAAVAREKIVDYLLDPAHPDNGGRTEFFTQHGFHRERREVPAAALKALAVESGLTVASRVTARQKYVIAGQIQSPGGKSPMVQTIWIVDKTGMRLPW
jgi:hypothetical protein